MTLSRPGRRPIQKPLDGAVKAGYVINAATGKWVRMKRFVVLLLPLLLYFWMSTASAESPPPLPPPQVPPTLLYYGDLAYVPNAHARQKLDLYVPRIPQGPLPLIVWIHGGGWKYGDRRFCPPLPWTKKGYVVASIDYRFCVDSLFPAQIEDCKAAVRWLRAHAASYKIDPNRIVAWGESAGGHLASLLGTSDTPEWEQGGPEGSSRVQAVIDWYGRADLTPVCTDESMAGSPSASLLGGSGVTVATLARKASPIFHVSQKDAPFLIMHGDRDELVPLLQSKRFAAALREAGVEVTLVVVKGAGHGGEEFLKTPQVRVIDSFLAANLGNPPGK
jgi:acetyl esterase/lipase